MSLWTDLAGMGMLYNAYTGMDTDRGKIMTDVQNLWSNQPLSGTTFTPYGITSNLGNFQGGQLGLGTQGNQMYNNAMGMYGMGQGIYGQGQEMFKRSMGDYSGYQQSAYDAMRAVQRPDEQRQTANMNANLAGAGRMGMTTGAFGGSPEQFANSKAIAEAQNTAAMNAYQAAQQQQMNDYTQGIGMSQMGQGLMSGGLSASATPWQLAMMQGGLGLQANQQANEWNAGMRDAYMNLFGDALGLKTALGQQQLATLGQWGGALLGAGRNGLLSQIFG